MRVFRFLSVFVAVAMLVVPATAAWAAKPDFWTFSAGGDDAYSCGSFSIQDEWSEQVRVRTYYDNAGNFTHWGANFTFTDRWYNPANGKEAFGKGEHEYLIQVPDEYVVYHGALYHVVVPGVGVVLIDAGYTTFTAEQAADPSQWTFHGNHQVLQQGDLSELCSALQ